MKILKSLLLIYIVVLSGLGASAQQFINYTYGNEVSTIVQNNLGIWIATRGGLVWYSTDYSQYLNFTHTNSDLPSNVVLDICKGNDNELWAIFHYPTCLGHYTGLHWEVVPTDSLPGLIPIMMDNAKCLTTDLMGSVWIGTGLGILKYDGTQFTVYDETNTPITSMAVRDITIDHSNRIIAGTFQGLAIFDGQNWTYYSDNNSGYPFMLGINSLAVTDNGTIWFASTHCGIGSFDGSVFTSYDSINSPLPGNIVNNLGIDPLGNLWISCFEALNYGYKGGLVKYNGTNWVIYDQSNTPLTKCEFSTLKCLEDGSILVLNDSLYHFDSQQWSCLNTSGSMLTSNIVDQLMKTPWNDIWVCTYGKGISRINGYNWYNYLTSSSTIPCNRYELSDYGPDSTAYFSFTDCTGIPTAQRFKKFKDGNWSNIPYDTLIYQMEGFACSNDGDFWWITHANPGYEIIHDSSGIISNYPLHSSNLFNFLKLFVKDDSLVFIFGHDDAYCINHGQITYQSGIDFPAGRLGNIEIGPDSAIYAAFEQGGDYTIYRFNGTNWSVYPVTVMGYQGQNISCFSWDHQGNLWIGNSRTGGGFSIYNGQSWQDFNVKTHPIPGGYYGSLVFDTNGNAWFGVEDGGLLVFNPDGVDLGLENSSKIKDNGLLCYPNPTDGWITIDLNNKLQKGLNIAIYNSSGSLVLNTTNHRQQVIKLNLTGFSPGLYLVQVSDGQNLHLSKVVKK